MGKEYIFRIKLSTEAFPYRSEVKSYEQFLEYKNEYETKYKEYIGIRKQIEDTQAQFSSLGNGAYPLLTLQLPRRPMGESCF